MAESTVVSCPNCGKKFKIGNDKLGRTFKCTGCETRFVAGGDGNATPAAPAAPVAQAPTAVAPPVRPAVRKAAPTPPPPVVETSDESETTETDYSSEAPAPAAGYSAGVGVAAGGKPKTSKAAIASLVFGLLSCVPLANVCAVVLGFVGLKKSKSGMGGKGLALAGIILGFLGIVANAGFGYFLVTKGRPLAQQVVCIDHMNRIAQSIRSYHDKNENHYPPDLKTLWASDPGLTGAIFVCPSSTDTAATTAAELESGGHNSYLYIYPGPDATSIDPGDVLLYEKSTDHDGKDMILFLGDKGAAKPHPMAEAQMLILTTKNRPHTSATIPGASN